MRLTYEQLRKLEDLTRLLEKDLQEEKQAKKLWVVHQFQAILSRRYTDTIPRDRSADATISRLQSELE